MKLLLFTLPILLVLSGVLAKPAPADGDDDVEMIDIPRRNATEMDLDDDDYFPYFFNFGSILDTVEDLFRGFKTSLHDIFTGADESGNTTSTIKVIDNHKVVINETTYQKDTPYGTQFVKVHRVSVHPLENNNSTTTIEGTDIAPEGGDIDDDNGSSELDASNSIPKDDQLESLEVKEQTRSKFAYVLEKLRQQQQQPQPQQSSQIESKSEDSSESIEFYDLLSPKIVVSSSRQPRPVFYNNRQPPYNFNYNPYPQNYPQNYPPQQAQPEVFVPQQDPTFQGPQQFPQQFDSSPDASEVYDLTNDIYVNQILAERGAPFHPDAEFISVPNQPRPRPFESYPQQYTPFYFTAFRDIKRK